MPLFFSSLPSMAQRVNKYDLFQKITALKSSMSGDIGKLKESLKQMVKKMTEKQPELNGLAEKMKQEKSRMALLASKVNQEEKKLKEIATQTTDQQHRLAKVECKLLIISVLLTPITNYIFSIFGNHKVTSSRHLVTSRQYVGQHCWCHLQC